MTSITSDEQDSQDMVQLAAGHDAALNDLMERHSEKIFHYLLRSLQSEDDAADLAQETFVKVYHNRSKFDLNQKFSTWLYAIASNLVRDRYRWRSRHPQVSMDAEDDEVDTAIKDTLVAPDARPDDNLEQRERADAVKNAIATLPDELREPLILAIYQGLPQADIGAILKCSVKAVETRIYRARNHLREKLAALTPST